MATNQYWATLTGQPLADEIYKRIDHYNAKVLTSTLQLGAKTFQSYYGTNGPATSSQITSGGKAGERSLLHLNISVPNSANHGNADFQATYAG